MEPLHGVLDMLVLRTLLFSPLHGYAIAGAIRDGSGVPAGAPRVGRVGTTRSGRELEQTRFRRYCVQATPAGAPVGAPRRVAGDATF